MFNIKSPTVPSLLLGAIGILIVVSILGIFPILINIALTSPEHDVPIDQAQVAHVREIRNEIEICVAGRGFGGTLVIYENGSINRVVNREVGNTRSHEVSRDLLMHAPDRYLMTIKKIVRPDDNLWNATAATYLRQFVPKDLANDKGVKP